MVNPFDLRGPQFLLFYICLGALATIVALWIRRSREAGVDATRPLSDYLEIAYLRGGSDGPPSSSRISTALARSGPAASAMRSARRSSRSPSSA